MNIINVNYAFKSQPIARKTTEWIVVHHTATTSATVDSIHRHHRDTNGWNGFGYHAFVDKKGNVYGGRPFGTQGAHCLGYNHNSVGICFEGNFEKEQMTREQIEQGIKLLRYLRTMYPEARITRHKDLNQGNLCPGKNFVDDIIVKAYEVENPVQDEDNEFNEKRFHLERLGEDTSHKALVYRLSEIYGNIFDLTDRQESNVAKKILKRRG
jgi:N-acetylmuramoyl-L-alanine amidase